MYYITHILSCTAQQSQRDFIDWTSFIIGVLSFLLSALFLLVAYNIKKHIKKKAEFDSIRDLYKYVESLDMQSSEMEKKAIRHAKVTIDSVLNKKILSNDIRENLQECSNYLSEENPDYVTFGGLLKKAVDIINHL